METNRDQLSWQTRLSAVLRVWRGPPYDSGVLCGTAFVVAPTIAVTALHVVEDYSKEDTHYFLQATWNGGFTIKIASVEPHSALDIAILQIDPPSAAPENAVIPLSIVPSLRPGDAIIMIGFADTHASAEAKFGHIQGIDGVAKAPIAGPYPARGMSGGPVVSHSGALLGATWSRDVDKGRAYIIPVASFAPFLIEHGVKSLRASQRAPNESIESDLRCYRTSDILQGWEARSLELSELCATFHRDPSRMIELVELANSRRMQDELGEPEAKTVSVFDLHPPENVSPARFWRAALSLAAVKSPRMHASLLLTLLESQPLSISQRELLLSVLNKLKAP